MSVQYADLLANKYNCIYNVTLTKANADLLFTVMDSTTQASFKRQLLHFHIVHKWMEANGCLDSVKTAEQQNDLGNR